MGLSWMYSDDEKLEKPEKPHRDDRKPQMEM